MIKVWIAAGIAGLVLIALLVLQTARLDAEQVRREAETRRADDNAAVATALKADAQRNAAIAADQAAALARVDAAKSSITREIIRVPDTSACRDSPAIGAVLDGLRRWPGAPAPGGPDDAGRRPDGGVRAPSRAP